MNANAYLTCAFLTVALTIDSAVAASTVNCDDIMRRLKSGASPRDLADTTSISIDKIEECQSQADLEAADSMLERDQSDERRKPLWGDEGE